jgi:hypothetical protein
MPKGVAKSGLRMTKQRLAAFEMTNPEVAQAYRDAQARKNPLHLAASYAEEMADHYIPVERTDEEIQERLDDLFEALVIMTEATAHGMNRSLIVSGPAGIGKTFESDRVLDNLGGDFLVKRVSGFMRLTGLYRVLYENRFSNRTIVFDDSDSIFADEDKLNLLKNATDTKEVRKITWGAETSMETDNGEAIPREFVFEGNIIFITNTDMQAAVDRGGRLSEHFEALISRSHYLAISMPETRDYIIRIKQVLSGGMLRKQGFTDSDEAVIVIFMEENADRLRELSLRMVLKLAQLYRMNPQKWERLAAATCMK